MGSSTPFHPGRARGAFPPFGEPRRLAFSPAAQYVVRSCAIASRCRAALFGAAFILTCGAQQDNMPPFSNSLRRHVEEYPLLAFCLLFALALPVAGALAGIQAAQWRDEHAQAAIAAKAADLGEGTHGVAEKVSMTFRNLHDLTTLIASGPNLPAALRDPSQRQALSGRFQTIARTLHLHRALLMDKSGVCIASNESDPSMNLLGISLLDREYVYRAMQGESFAQLVVGRVSSVPGFHFSTPVMQNGKVLGVLALKMNLETLGKQVAMSSGVISDALGVVVIASNPDRLLMAMPGSPVLAFDEAKSLRRYKRPRLAPLRMERVTVYGQEAFRLDGEETPTLVRVERVPDENLTVYGFSSLKGVLEETEMLYTQRLGWYFLATALFLGIVAGGLVHVIRDRSQRRALEALNQELARQARRDPLTHCYNRRSFDEVLEREGLRSARNGEPFSLALIDLDRFKEVNDTYGHTVGDAVLVQVADVIRGELRQVDSVARIGGDEFAALMPGADAQAAVEIMRRLVERFQASPLQTSLGPFSQTISVGISSSKGDMTSLQMTEAADRALYESKRLGRNQVAVHQPVEG